MSAAGAAKGDDTAAYAAVATIYHAYLTGLILALVTRAGKAQAAEVVFAPFAGSSLPASCRD